LQFNQLSLNTSTIQRLIDSVLDLHPASFHYDRIVVFNEHQEIAIVSLEKFSHGFRQRDLEFPRNG
jgi:hypothetical protein